MSQARLSQALHERLAAVLQRQVEIDALLTRPEVFADATQIEQLGREQSQIEPIVKRGRALQETERGLEDGRSLLEDPDPEVRTMAELEVRELEEREERLLAELLDLLSPSNANDLRDVILEIRAGTGGDEAALFAADLLRMYLRYAEARGWKSEVLTSSETELGGFREVIVEVAGKGAYSRLKFESGVHRVQRVPTTETSGRIHTSTATVAVMPKVDEVEVHIAEEDLRIDVYRSTGHGGQSVNTTDSAVRITHLPTGMVVTCQDEKSQLKNKIRAMAVLRARLFALQEQEQHNEQAALRRSQVGTGERSEKIRTYNFRENRVTDHRIGVTLHSIEALMAGQLDPLIDPLVVASRTLD